MLRLYNETPAPWTRTVPEASLEPADEAGTAAVMVTSSTTHC